MKKQNGITLIALIITIIIMLILVGVTINVALNGGLFTTAQNAADGTKKEAEKEQLLEAILAAVGTDGEVDFAKVVLPEGFSKVIGKKGVYTGKSGITYAVNEKTLEITESSGGSETVNNSMLGTYYSVGGDVSGPIGFSLKENGLAEMIGFFGSDETNLSAMSGTYTYDDTTKKGTITIQVKEEDSTTGELVTNPHELQFEYATIVDENETIINYILEMNVSDSIFICAKEKYAGLIPLGNNIYENGTTTIEFGTTTIDGSTSGTYIFKFNGTPADSGYEGNYVCYNGNLLWGEEMATVASDYSTVTLSDGTVYTLKQ